MTISSTNYSDPVSLIHVKAIATATIPGSDTVCPMVIFNGSPGPYFAQIKGNGSPQLDVASPLIYWGENKCSATAVEPCLPYTFFSWSAWYGRVWIPSFSQVKVGDTCKGCLYGTRSVFCHD